ncbi:hypothetical protein Q5425_44885 [Amycolatopsis sp. A133]|uniref:hypothetical protein n=1 Tax=Amycolatopsis sp. A133 TaxID=3064472 RepID=UPI0027F9B8AB|nr:hypothetical protein [Amycolatopsis sp. A133]MDQ7810904.1 hypothetical protein [Amycolatopsis sp. A133]
MTAGDPGRTAGAGLVPALELAARLDRYAESLLRNGFRPGAAAPARRCVDLADGLTRAAEALRSADRGDPGTAERQLRSAVALLEEMQP